jgi:hypothetical protein
MQRRHEAARQSQANITQKTGISSAEGEYRTLQAEGNRSFSFRNRHATASNLPTVRKGVNEQMGKVARYAAAVVGEYCARVRGERGTERKNVPTANQTDGSHRQTITTSTTARNQ